MTVVDYLFAPRDQVDLVAADAAWPAFLAYKRGEIRFHDYSQHWALMQAFSNARLVRDDYWAAEAEKSLS